MHLRIVYLSYYFVYIISTEVSFASAIFFDRDVNHVNIFTSFL